MIVQIFESIKTPKPMQPWYVRLVSENGQTLTTSEGYFSKWNAKRAATRMFPDLEIKYTEQ